MLKLTLRMPKIAPRMPKLAPEHPNRLFGGNTELYCLEGRHNSIVWQEKELYRLAGRHNYIVWWEDINLMFGENT